MFLLFDIKGISVHQADSLSNHQVSEHFYVNLSLGGSPILLEPVDGRVKEPSHLVEEPR